MKTPTMNGIAGSSEQFMRGQRMDMNRGLLTRLAAASLAAVPRFAGHFLFLLVAASAALLPTQAQAIPTTYAAAFPSCLGCGPGNEDHGTIYSHAEVVASDGFRAESAFATAAPGELHAFADASTAECCARAMASALADFTDSVTVGAPIGVTSVDLVISLDLRGSCSGTAGATAGTPNSGCGVQAVVENIIVLDHPGTISAVRTVAADSVFSFNSYLQVDGFAWNGAFAADFADTGHVYLWSTTPGVVLTSESGHDYAPPVPEPGTSALLLAGVSVVALRWRRQRRGQR